MDYSAVLFINKINGSILSYSLNAFSSSNPITSSNPNPNPYTNDSYHNLNILQHHMNYK